MTKSSHLIDDMAVNSISYSMRISDQLVDIESDQSAEPMARSISCVTVKSICASHDKLELISSSIELVPRNQDTHLFF